MKTILLYITIALMIYLILYSIIDTRKSNRIEGFEPIEMDTPVNDTIKPLEYKEDPEMTKSPLYLATVNSANISYLKGKIDEIISIRNELNETKNNVEINTNSIKTISDSMKELKSKLVPTKTQ